MTARRVLLFTALSLANLLVIWSPDVLPASLFAWTVVREGDVDYDEFTFLDRESYFFRACGESTATAPPSAARAPGGPPAPGPADRVCSIFPPGAAILALPFFAPFALAGAPPDDLPLLLVVGKLVAALEEGVAAALLVAAASRVASQRWALAVGLLYLLATAVRTVSAQALWQHGAAHLLLAFALWVLVRDHTAGGSRRGLFAAGLALGFAIVVRQTSGVFALAALGAQVAARRPLGALAAGVLTGVLPLFAYDVVAFGQAFEQGYGEKPFTTPPLDGLYGLLLSPSRGLFVYSPFLLFALPPLARAWRSREATAPLLRAFGLASLALLGVYTTYAEWWGGRVFGARFLSDAFPVLALALAVAPPARTWSRAFFAVAAAWSLLLHNAAALVYDQRWDTFPTNVNFAPQRLFDWADPQWLAVLADAARPDLRVIAALALTVVVLAAIVWTERRVLLYRPR